MESIEIQQFNDHRIATAWHEAGGNSMVIFCHGYRGSMIGPSRWFVTVARRLAKKGVSSLRFDQYGSGNSEGDFYDSSFNDWVATTEAMVRDYLAKGYRVALFGQSMGGATVIDVASRVPEVSAVVAWVPDPNVDTLRGLENEFVEESGQRVRTAYWREAHDAKVADTLRSTNVPMYIVQCSEDEYVSAENHRAIEDNAGPRHTVEMFYGLPHSSWPYDDGNIIVGKSIEFLLSQFQALPDVPAGD